MMLVHKDVPEALVHDITAAVFEHLPELHAAHPSLRSVSLAAASGTPIPLHEGAKRYFMEHKALPVATP